MPQGKTAKPPSYRRQKRPNGKDVAFVEMGGVRLYLGPHGSSESHEMYARSLAEWRASGGNLPVEDKAITVAELLARFWPYAEDYYRKPDGTPTSTLYNFRSALRPVAKLYARSKVADFTAQSLLAVRETMIQDGWTRRTINKNVKLVARTFSWGVKMQMVPAGTLVALNTVESLKRGRTVAPDNPPRSPVPEADVTAIRPYVSRQVYTVARLQLLTGARGSELLGLRPVDLTMTGEVWTATIADHKTAHLGHTRTLYFGPRSQMLLGPFPTDRPVDRPMFSPVEAEQERHARAETHRRHGQMPSPARTARKLTDRYDKNSYGRAIKRACELAEITPWSPHQIRHTAATSIRKEYGLEAASILLGHAGLAVTEIYALRDGAKALEAAKKIG